MIELAESGGMKRALQAGLLVGLAAATKYTGAVLLAPLVLATMMGMRDGPPRAAAPASTVARVSAVLSPVILAYLVFLVLNPFVLFDTAGLPARLRIRADAHGGGPLRSPRRRVDAARTISWMRFRAR